MADEPLPAEADALYGLPPGEFVAGRDALAKRLRAAGRRDEAAAVKALRRPSAAAAAVNRAARAHPDAVRELLAAGDNLRRAQERLIAGSGDRAVLREAAEHQRAAVAALAALAAAAAQEAGTHLSAPLVDRVRETLQAAATDAAVAGALAAGRLEREAGPAGIGFGPAVAAEPPVEADRRRRADGTARAPRGGAAAGAAREDGDDRAARRLPAARSARGKADRRAAREDAGARAAREEAEARAAREEAEARASRGEADARLRVAAEAARRLDREMEEACRELDRRTAVVAELRSRLDQAEAEAADARTTADTARARLREAKAEEAAAHAAREAATRSR